ncbi:MAG: response regulator [Acidimicrobiales bacterium]
MTDHPPLRILVCDDHPLFRRAVVTSLEEAGFDVVAEAATGTDAVARAIDYAPDVIVMDLRMPDGSGAEATAAIRAARPWSKILALSVSDDLDEIVGAIRAGATGHLRKEESMGVLADSLRTVHHGGVVLGVPLARRVRLELDRVADAVGHDADAWAPSPRQLALLDAISDGRSLTEAADSAAVDPQLARAELANALEGLRRHVAAADLADRP